MKNLYSKILFVFVVAIASFSTAMAENVITTPDFSIKAGETKTYNVYVTLTEAVTTLQVDLYLPEGKGLSWANGTGNPKWGGINTGDTSKERAQIVANEPLHMKYAAGGGTNFPAVEKTVLFSVDITASEDFNGAEITTGKTITGRVKESGPRTIAVTLDKEEEEEYPIGFTVKDFEIVRGKSQSFDVILNYDQVMTTVQIQFTLPSGLSWKDGDGSPVVYRASGDPTKYQCKPLTTDPNTVLFAVAGGASVSAGSGPVLNLTVVADTEFKEGDIVTGEKVIYGRNKVPGFKFHVTGVDATSIDAIQTISDDAVIYNIAGQRVNANAKGLVIKNGKKFINK